jgi:hypothetical protein
VFLILNKETESEEKKDKRNYYYLLLIQFSRLGRHVRGFIFSQGS